MQDQYPCQPIAKQFSLRRQRQLEYRIRSEVEQILERDDNKKKHKPIHKFLSQQKRLNRQENQDEFFQESQPSLYENQPHQKLSQCQQIQESLQEHGQRQQTFSFVWVAGSRHKKKKQYICGCGYKSHRKNNFFRHHTHCKNNKAEDLIPVHMNKDIQLSLEGQEKHNILRQEEFNTLNQIQVIQLIDKRLFQFTSKNSSLRNPLQISRQIFDYSSTAIKEAVILNLAKQLQEMFLIDQNYLVKPRELAANVVKAISQINFKNFIVSFEQELKQSHKMIQAKNSPQSKTFKNNQLCFRRIKGKKEYELRNKHTLLNYTLTLTSFVRDDLNRYLNLLKKQSIFFSTFPPLPILNIRAQDKARLVPFSYAEGALQIQRIFHSQPVLAADMWAIMTLALRSNDLLKVQLWRQDGCFVKIISLQQNKTKSVVYRYLPKSLIKIGYVSGASYPMSKSRLKVAISTCLRLFKCAYSFKHRAITQMVASLGNTNKFLQFHRNSSTTVNYYIDKNDQKLLDQVFTHGINFLLDSQVNVKIEDRNLLLDLSVPPEKHFKQITIQKLTEITLDFRNQVQDRIVSSLVDSGKADSQIFSEVNEDIGQAIYMSNNYQVNFSEQESFLSIEQCVSSVVGAENFEKIQQNCLMEANYLTSKEIIFCQGLSQFSNNSVHYTEFNGQSDNPQITKRIQCQSQSDNLVLISSSKNEKRSNFKIYSFQQIQPTLQNQQRKINRQQREAKKKVLSKFHQQMTLIYKRQPKCPQCRLLNKISILIIGNQCVECSVCDYKEYIELKCQNNQLPIRFQTTGDFYAFPLRCPKRMKSMNNLRFCLKERFSLQNTYSSTVPRYFTCNFVNFDNCEKAIEQFKRNIDYLPIQIRPSLIAGAGEGLFAKTFIPENSLISIYPGYIDTNYGTNLASNSLFRLGWFKIDGHWVQLISDGLKISDGGRYANTHQNPKKINLSLFEGVYHREIIIAYISNKDIEEGQEILCNYGQAFDLNLKNRES